MCTRSSPLNPVNFFLALVLMLIFPAFLSCSPKPAQIAYLSPLDRVQEGFADPTTYQIITYGRALDLTKVTDPKQFFYPHSISETFDHEEFIKYNADQQVLIKARKPTTGFLFSEVMAAEANQLNPQEVNLSLLDEKIRGPMEIKRVLFDNACAAAQIMGLYRWLIGDGMQMKLLHGATLPAEGISKTSLDSRFFPPRDYYVAESKRILQNLDLAMQKRKFTYEIIHEVFSKSEQLECKVAIHIHKRNLQVNMPFLAPL